MLFDQKSAVHREAGFPRGDSQTDGVDLGKMASGANGASLNHIKFFS